MTLVTGTVEDIGFDPVDGTLWARPARFRSDGGVVRAPERTPYPITGGALSVTLAPGPAVLELRVGSHARGTFEVVIPEEDISLADLLDTVFPWEPEQVSLFVAERLAAEQAKSDAEQAAQTASGAAGTATTAAGTATTAAQQAAQERSHIDQVRTELDEAFDASTAGNVLPPRLTEAALSATYADLPTVQAVDERTAPQKMLFGLPVPKPHRAPNLAVMDVVPTSEFDGQVILAEGTTLWAVGRDSSLYKSTKRDVWTHVAYRSLGIQRRGGITRCKDGSLLLFTSVDFAIQRSTDEGKTWTTVLPRRTAGLEPLTTQSITVHGETGHIFYGEYTNNPTASWPDVTLWRSTDHGATWAQFHVWPRAEVTPGPTAIRHIHGVQYDPIGKKIYVMCGDSTDATGIWRVEGETCVPVVTNAHMPEGFFDAPRSIGLMFFPDYIAWGSDSTANPYLFRIARAAVGDSPAPIERGPRLSSTAWGTARASEDGARWAMFASDEAYPSFAADRQAHVYAVEDQGATLYEVGAISSQMTSGVTTLQPCGPAESFSDHFWFNMRTGENGRNAAWKGRLGYGGQSIPWPSTKSGHLIQSQSSGRIAVEGNASIQFGITRVPSFGRTLAIYDSSLVRFAGEVGHVSVQVRSGGTTLYTSAAASNRQASRMEQGGPIFTIELPANADVEFHINNGRPTPADGFASITFGFLR